LGVSGWNSTVDRELGNLARGQWYIGRPVIVLTNDYVNNLSNGDVGIVCADEDDQRFVVFDGENGIRRIPVSKLPPVATVHALTIHKSQGSEYGHTVVLLSTKLSRIVTRELVYTGITRTKTRLTLVATEAVLENAVNTPIRRATGLAHRLNLLLKGSHH
jgi:exodeoxyribonuclease V alpha subunit